MQHSRQQAVASATPESEAPTTTEPTSWLGALAGCVGGGNAFAASLTGREMEYATQRDSGWEFREKDRAGAELDRRVEPSGAGPADGSGEWGCEEATLTDEANKTMWMMVADVAEGIGHVNAARHMRHFLGNTGTALEVDADLMLRDAPGLGKKLDREIETMKAAADTEMKGRDPSAAHTFTLEGAPFGHYFGKDVSADWYFAVGGCTAWCEATAFYEPGEGGGTLTLAVVLHVHDNYNWDQGKSVSILGVPVKDEQLGRLHKAGLAREFEVDAVSSPRLVSWAWTPGSEVPETIPTGDGAGEYEGTRADPTRSPA